MNNIQTSTPLLVGVMIGAGGMTIGMSLILAVAISNRPVCKPLTPPAMIEPQALIEPEFEI